MLARIRYFFRDRDYNTSYLSLWAEGTAGEIATTALSRYSLLQSLSDAELYQFVIDITVRSDDGRSVTTGDVTRHLLIVGILESGNYAILDIPSPQANLFPIVNAGSVGIVADLTDPRLLAFELLMKQLSDEYGTKFQSIVMAGLAL